MGLTVGGDELQSESGALKNMRTGETVPVPLSAASIGEALTAASAGQPLSTAE